MRVLVLWVRNCSRARALIVGAGRKRGRRRRRRRQRGRRRWWRRRRRRREVVEDDAGEPGTSQHGFDVRIRRRAGGRRPRRRRRRTEHGARLGVALERRRRRRRRRRRLVEPSTAPGRVRRVAGVQLTKVDDRTAGPAARGLRAVRTLAVQRASAAVVALQVGRRQRPVQHLRIKLLVGVMHGGVGGAVDVARVATLARVTIGDGRAVGVDDDPSQPRPAARRALGAVVATEACGGGRVAVLVGAGPQDGARVVAAVGADVDRVAGTRARAQPGGALVRNLRRRARAVKRVHKGRCRGAGRLAKVGVADLAARRAVVKVKRRRQRRREHRWRRRRRRGPRVVGHALEGVAVDGLREPVVQTGAVGGVGAETAHAGQRVLVSVGGLGHKRRPRPTVLAHAVVAVRARVVLLDGPRV